MGWDVNSFIQQLTGGFERGRLEKEQRQKEDDAIAQKYEKEKLIAAKRLADEGKSQQEVQKQVWGEEDHQLKVKKEQIDILGKLMKMLGVEQNASTTNETPTDTPAASPTATPTATPTPTPEQFLLDYSPYIADQGKIDEYYPNGIPQPSPELLDIIRQVSPDDATRSGIINLTESGFNMKPKDYTGNSNGTTDRGTNMVNSGTFDWLQGTPYNQMMEKSGIENYGDMFDPMKNENMKDIIRKIQGYKAWFGPRNKGFKHGL